MPSHVSFGRVSARLANSRLLCTGRCVLHRSTMSCNLPPCCRFVAPREWASSVFQLREHFWLCILAGVPACTPTCCFYVSIHLYAFVYLCMMLRYAVHLRTCDVRAFASSHIIPHIVW